MNIENRTNVTEAEMPRELAEIHLFSEWGVLRRENGKIYALMDCPIGELGKYVYDESNRKIIENESFEENDWSLDDRIWSSFILIGIPSLINWARHPEIRERFYKTQEWKAIHRRLREANECEHRKRLEELAAPIRLYQGSIAEVERDVNMRLKRIDTQTPETFLRAPEAFDLRVRAAQLGANAVVHYRAQKMDAGDGYDEVFHLGTPVKFTGPLYHSPHDIIVEEASCREQQSL